MQHPAGRRRWEHLRPLLHPDPCTPTLPHAQWGLRVSPHIPTLNSPAEGDCPDAPCHSCRL